MSKKVWNGKIEKDEFVQLQEASAKIMGLKKEAEEYTDNEFPLEVAYVVRGGGNGRKKFKNQKELDAFIDKMDNRYGEGAVSYRYSKLEANMGIKKESINVHGGAYGNIEDAYKELSRKADIVMDRIEGWHRMHEVYKPLIEDLDEFIKKMDPVNGVTVVFSTPADRPRICISQIKNKDVVSDKTFMDSFSEVVLKYTEFGWKWQQDISIYIYFSI